jgi:hypothetical protein
MVEVSSAMLTTPRHEGADRTCWVGLRAALTVVGPLQATDHRIE